MEKKTTYGINEVIAGSSDKQLSRKMSGWLKSGEIRKIAPRLYSSNFKDSADVIIRRNLFEVLSLLYPGAILSHRSAFEFGPTEGGQIFLTYRYTKKVSLPGLVIRFLKGPGPVEGDRTFSGKLMVSQEARAYLENFQLSRGRGPENKCLSREVLEQKLDLLIRTHGEAALNDLRDRARILAGELDMQREFQELDRLAGALLATWDSGVIRTEEGFARAAGTPYDPARIMLFQDLLRELEIRPIPLIEDPNASPLAFRHFAFFESYFSNYIEGTEFTVDVARSIIDSGRPLPSRNEDSHDILGTFRLAADRSGLAALPGATDDFLDLLKERHEVLMRARSNMNPGSFKTRNNRAVNTEFVDWQLVEGTLRRGYELFRVLNHPFKRAAFMLFLVSEVHPFDDGNGRLARIMMNAELVAAGQSKILIPTVYRDDYLGALRGLTRRSRVEPFFDMLVQAMDFSSGIRGDTFVTMQQYLERSNAFLEPTEGKLIAYEKKKI